MHTLKRHSLLIIALLLLSYGGWRFFTVYVTAPSLDLPSPHARTPFMVDFALPDLAGNMLRLTDFHGQPVLINLWATWCPPCQREMPSLQALYNDFSPHGLVIVAIASDADGAAAVGPVQQQHGLRFPLLLDPQDTVGKQLHLLGVPTTYLLDRQGRIVRYEIGGRNWNSPAFRRLVSQLLAEKPDV